MDVSSWLSLGIYADHGRGPQRSFRCLRPFGTGRVAIGLVGWSIGDALVNAADENGVDELLTIANETDLGKARQMIVYSLWRFRKDRRIAATLEHLVTDADVALHAASACGRTVGNDVALKTLTRARDRESDPAVQRVLDTEIKKARRASAELPVRMGSAGWHPVP